MAAVNGYFYSVLVQTNSTAEAIQLVVMAYAPPRELEMPVFLPSPLPPQGVIRRKVVLYTSPLILDFSFPNQIRLDLRQTSPPLPTLLPDPHMTIFFRVGRKNPFTAEEKTRVIDLTKEWRMRKGGDPNTLEFTLTRWGPGSDHVIGHPQYLYHFLCTHAKLEQGRCIQPHIRLR